MKPTLILINALAAAALAGACALPEEPEALLSRYSPGADEASGIEGREEMLEAFDNLDDDDDGLITRFEAIEWPALTSGFRAADEDESDTLDLREFERARVSRDLGRL